MVYKIKIDYATTLEFDQWDDFINALRYLFEGGVAELTISKTKKEVIE